jgi:hypothetical protein
VQESELVIWIGRAEIPHQRGGHPATYNTLNIPNASSRPEWLAVVEWIAVTGRGKFQDSLGILGDIEGELGLVIRVVSWVVVRMGRSLWGTGFECTRRKEHSS